MIDGFKHCIEEKVKFHEVDMLGVCNNAVYFNYFEDARIKYIQDLKKKFNLTKILENGSFFIMAHNFCNYITPSKLDDELNVYTKIDFIKNSSFGFKHFVLNKNTGENIADGGGVVVQINTKSNGSQPLPEEFYSAVQQYDEKVTINKTL